MSSCGAHNIAHLILAEDICNLDFLLKEAHGEVNLLRSSATVDLDLLDVGFLLSNLDLANLCMANSADHLAILLCPLNLSGHWGALATLAGIAPALLVLTECLLFGRVPGFVKAAPDFFVQVPSPDRRQCTEAARVWIFIVLNSS